MAGLSAILAVSATAFTVVKLVGVAYLTYLGVKMLWHSRRITEPVAEDGEPDPGSVLTLRQAYRQGLLCNLLNPKIALLFLTLLPQFVSEGEPRLLTSAELAVAFLLLAVVWWRVFSWAVAPLGKFLRRPKPAAWVERVTGAVLIGLAARVAFERAA